MGTPLDPIPGTPNAEQQAPTEQPNQMHDRKCDGCLGHSTTKCARRSLSLNREITSRRRCFQAYHGEGVGPREAPVIAPQVTITGSPRASSPAIGSVYACKEEAS